MSQKSIEEKEREGLLWKKQTRKNKRIREKGTLDHSAHKHVAMVKNTHRMPVETLENID